ncbi:phage tail protein [Vibrio sp. La 4.2.2]|uniref:phage tail protein n=1 Tax=Vibrio sp. La 4.2.2 TaxID=2998830 RepID=UPI0022CE2546|nr:phage tail protein [Vibrio sp. La 4.2.2]MDA0107827.1 phage tail protein [Vibrio sp. La 4.2.2]
MATWYQSPSVYAHIKIAAQRLQQFSNTAVPNAVYRSINQVGMVSERQTIKAIAKAERIPQKAIRPRIRPIKRASARSPSRQTKVRLAPLMASRLGTLRQTRRGVSVGRHRFVGAFIADGHHGYGRYVTKRQRHRSHRPYRATTLNQTMVLKRKAKGRYPLVAIKLDIQTVTLEHYRRQVRWAYNHLFPQEMAKQLRREVDKLVRRWA